MGEIILLIILLFLTAFTAVAEISIIAISRLRLRRLALGGSRNAKIILKMLETPERFFSTILVANSFINTLIASIITVIMISVIKNENRAVLAATILASIIIIIFEVVAKTLAANHPEKISLLLAKPVDMLITTFAPIIKVLVYATNFILKFIGGAPSGKNALMSEEEIRTAIKLGEEEGVLHKDKYKMLVRVFDFSEAIVRSVMTPKKDIVAIDVRAGFDDILNKALESGYSRIPVYQDSPDNITGMINMKDLLTLSHNRELLVLQDIIYLPTFVSESKKVTELLKDFQKGHAHLAVVTDDKNKVVGIVTLEDLLEEIVGEIEDEHDIRAGYYNKVK